jgi:hypothetical protein
MNDFNDKNVSDPEWIAGDEEHAQAECGVSGWENAAVATSP